MNERFELDHRPLKAVPKFAALAKSLREFGPIDSVETFNGYARAACWEWQGHLGDNGGNVSTQFSELFGRIERREENTIATGWGGVVITLHEHPRVEKYLVVRCRGYLALEKHAEKDEHLEVREGAGLILYRAVEGKPLSVQALAPGDRFHFEPGREHCLIGTEDLLVFERSVDPKGMDQDLIFIYEPTGMA